jgi:hypothetical protein
LRAGSSKRTGAGQDAVGDIADKITRAPKKAKR